MRAREAFDLAIALANMAAEAAGIRRHIDRPKGGVAMMKRVISPRKGRRRRSRAWWKRLARHKDFPTL